MLRQAVSTARHRTDRGGQPAVCRSRPLLLAAHRGSRPGPRPHLDRRAL